MKRIHGGKKTKKKRKSHHALWWSKSFNVCAFPQQIGRDCVIGAHTLSEMLRFCSKSTTGCSFATPWASRTALVIDGGAGGQQSVRVPPPSSPQAHFSFAFSCTCRPKNTFSWHRFHCVSSNTSLFRVWVNSIRGITHEITLCLYRQKVFVFFLPPSQERTTALVWIEKISLTLNTLCEIRETVLGGQPWEACALVAGSLGRTESEHPGAAGEGEGPGDTGCKSAPKV